MRRRPRDAGPRANAHRKRRRRLHRELRAIHDLLYRPQTAPDEDVLESILRTWRGACASFHIFWSA